MVERLLAEGSEHVTLPIGRKSLASLAPGRRRCARCSGANGPTSCTRVRACRRGWAGWRCADCRPRPRFVTTVHGLQQRRRLQRHHDARRTRDLRVQHRARSPVAQLSAHRSGAARGDSARHRSGRVSVRLSARQFLARMVFRRIRATRRRAAADPARARHAAQGPRRRDRTGRRPQARGIPTPPAPARRAPGRARGLHRRTGGAGTFARCRRLASRSAPRATMCATSTRSRRLVLQLSNKPESFGRTVIEALSLCRPVLGYDHGGVGELLAELYPAGRVPAGDRDRLVERAAELLRAAPAISPLHALPSGRHAGRRRWRCIVS